MENLGQKKKLITIALGQEPADIVIKNVSVADVFNGKWTIGDVAIVGEEIAGIGRYSGKTEIDGSGKFLMPSFYDAHLHFESVMTRPSEYLKLSIPKGVTAYNADPHEIANVLGRRGIEFMLDDVKGLPADVRFMMPSCVPATSEDDSGAVLDSANCKECINDLGLFGLGEMMNYVGVLNADEDVLHKLDTELPIDGHAPSLADERLNAYIAGGINTDHECVTAEEAAEKVSKGMYVLLRQGSQAQNLKTLISAVTPVNLRRFLFCTDDRNIEDLVKSGTIGYCVKLAVESGLSAVDAITIASLNAYEAYGIKKHGAIAPAYKANLILSRDQTAQDIDSVFYRGRIVAKDGKALFEVGHSNIDGVTDTVHIKPLTAKDMEFEFNPKLPIMRVFPGTLYTEKIFADSADKLNVMCSIERHKATGKIGHCFVSGFDLSGGAIAQTVGHDAHNITVIGDNPTDMALAVNSLSGGGGLVVVSDGKVCGKLPLEIAGLMSADSAETVLDLRHKLYSALQCLHYNKQLEPFMLLSFLTLTVIPDVKLNARGLFSVSEWKYLYKG